MTEHEKMGTSWTEQTEYAIGVSGIDNKKVYFPLLFDVETLSVILQNRIFDVVFIPEKLKLELLEIGWTDTELKLETP